MALGAADVGFLHLCNLHWSVPSTEIDLRQANALLQPGFERQWQAKSVRHAAEISYVAQLLIKAIRVSSSTTTLNNSGDFEKVLHSSSSPQATFLRITVRTSDGYGKGHGIDCPLPPTKRLSY